jgi:hypothetical protein
MQAPELQGDVDAKRNGGEKKRMAGEGPKGEANDDQPGEDPYFTP